MLQDQDFVVRLERHFRRAAAREREPYGADVAPGPVALEQIGGIDRHAQRVRELALRAVGGKPGDLGVLQVGADLWPAGELHEVPQRHSILPRVPARLGDHP